MKCLFIYTVVILVCSGVIAAPKHRNVHEQDDDVEEELIRNHHSTAVGNSRLAADDNSVSTDDDIEHSETFLDQSVNDDKSFEDGLYDITVGDVIYDVLLTLRDHPEIVKELLASEKTNVEDENYNAVPGDNSVGDDLAGYPSDQLNSVPKSVEKKAGRSGMPVLPGNVAEKRQAELTNYAFTGDDVSTDGSRDYREFMNRPMEGGEEEKFNYKQFISDSYDTESTDSTETIDDTETADASSSSESSESDDSDADSESNSSFDESKEYRYKMFQMPLISPFGNSFGYRLQRPYGYKYSQDKGSKDSSEKWRHYVNSDDSDSTGDKSDSNNEDQLFGLMNTGQRHKDEDDRSSDNTVLDSM